MRTTHTDCPACRVARERRLSDEWTTTLLHDLSASGVSQPLLDRVASLATPTTETPHAATASTRARLAVGDEIHGFAGGAFGRDSYHCRIVEAVLDDVLLTRNTRGHVETITRAEADLISDPAALTHCDEDRAGVCEEQDALDRLRARILASR